MEATRATFKIPPQLANCPFTQDSIQEAVVTVCNHFFERQSFLKYVKLGGRKCIACREYITYYAEIPNVTEALNKEVTLPVIKLEGEHRIAQHQESITLEEDIVKTLFLIEYAATNQPLVEMLPFARACNEKDGGSTSTIRARIKAEVETANYIAALQRHQELLKGLYGSFSKISEYDTIQDFVNGLFNDDTTFFLYNHLLREANIDMFHRSANVVMGGKGVNRESDGEKVIADAEWGKKFRAVMGLLFAVALMIGIGRKVFRLA